MAQLKPLDVGWMPPGRTKRSSLIRVGDRVRVVGGRGHGLGGMFQVRSINCETRRVWVDIVRLENGALGGQYSILVQGNARKAGGFKITRFALRKIHV